MHPLKKYLLDKNLAVKDFAASIGTVPNYLSQIFCGARQPSDDMVEAIVRETGGEVNYADLRPDKAAKLDNIRKLESGSAIQ